ncbi:MAG: hypothetical protein HYZ30_01715 [Candidatus Azosocius agrarius]|nr:MAG: hypothetical protein HYZ30_01715 [Gammaproteobacteria bacterium]
MRSKRRTLGLKVKDIRSSPEKAEKKIIKKSISEVKSTNIKCNLLYIKITFFYIMTIIV